MNPKILLGLKSPGNWMLAIATAFGLVQQVRPCLTGHAAAIADAAFGLVGAIGVVWNTLHIHESMMTEPPKPAVSL